MRNKFMYRVYLIGLGYGCYSREYYREFVGTTWATSEKQAANNMHYRLRSEGWQMPDTQVDSAGLGYVTYVLKAERA